MELKPLDIGSMHVMKLILQLSNLFVGEFIVLNNSFFKRVNLISLVMTIFIIILFESSILIYKCFDFFGLNIKETA